MKREEKDEPEGASFPHQSPLSEYETSPHEKEPEQKGDYAAGSFHVGRDKMEETHEQGIDRRENVIEGLAEATVHEFLGNRGITYAVQLDRR